MVAAQDGLVEHSLVAADERPLEGLHDGAKLILSGPADVEHLFNVVSCQEFRIMHYTMCAFIKYLAVVVHISVVSVVPALAAEVEGEGRVQVGVGLVREAESKILLLQIGINNKTLLLNAILTLFRSTTEFLFNFC